jgi:glutamyl aminopeptidase
MENWGLITYRETSLLYAPGESSAAAQQWVAIVVAHELAHQWFGNLVTMKWWNDLWLNEGFASWMEYKGVAHTQPSWAMEEQFWAHVVMPALQLDSLASSHPVSVPVNDPKDIEAIFDTISYKKVNIWIFVAQWTEPLVSRAPPLSTCWSST